MASRRQHGTPLVVADHEDMRSVSRLERVSLTSTGEEARPFDEAWLQRLIHMHPELLPIAEIEPAFLPAIPVCLELPTPKGFIDNFFITPTGNLLFAECKLWSNPEARREVVAQVMDYVEGLTSWSYESLEDAVRKGQLPGGGKPQSGLYELLGDEPELEEPEFIDAVSRNLRLGRGLFFIVGDGIREETESLVAHLQAHAGIHFVLGLVELAVFELPNKGGLLIHPRVIARTVNIERGIVRIDDARISVEPPKPTAGEPPEILSEEEFYAKLAEHDPKLPVRLRAFLERIKPLGVKPEIRRSLILRWRAVDGTSLNLGYILTDGEIVTNAVNWRASQFEILDIAHDYVSELAEAIGGKIKSMPNDEDSSYVTLNDHIPRIGTLLDHEDAWVSAIERLSDRVNERFESRDT